jgi:hypothetical protein
MIASVYLPLAPTLYPWWLQRLLSAPKLRRGMYKLDPLEPKRAETQHQTIQREREREEMTHCSKKNYHSWGWGVGFGSCSDGNIDWTKNMWSETCVHFEMIQDWIECSAMTAGMLVYVGAYTPPIKLLSLR